MGGGRCCGEWGEWRGGAINHAVRVCARADDPGKKKGMECRCTQLMSHAARSWGEHQPSINRTGKTTPCINAPRYPKYVEESHDARQGHGFQCSTQDMRHLLSF